MLSHSLLALLAVVSTSARNIPITSGDWIGELRFREKSEFAQLRFSEDSTGLAGSLNLPVSNRWGIRAAARLSDGRLQLSFVHGSDTACVTAHVWKDSIAGDIALGSPATKVGHLTLVHRQAYDSSIVRPLTGNYRIGRDRIISMGPMDEANGWLSFFDSKTRRGGILYALSDSVFFTGPSFGIDYPIDIRATVRRRADGSITSLRWTERGKRGLSAVRLDDIVQKNISFMNGEVRLVGNITAPRQSGRYPAVVLVHGCCGIKPTRDFGYWSSYLAHHGIVVLAFDKRGGGESSGDANTASYQDFADDVLAGVDELLKQADVDPKSVGLYGMSNGGYIGPLAASRSAGKVAFIAVRSGSSRRVGGNIDYEVGNDLRSEGFDEDAIRRGVSIRARVTAFVINHPALTMAAWDSLKAEVSAVQNERWFPWSRTLWVPHVSPADSGGRAYVDALRAAWEFDPLPYWRQLRIPVYVMLGGLDRSVPTAETAAALRATFSSSGNRNATVRVFPAGNHGLLVARNGYAREIYSLAYYVPDFQAGLVRWIKGVAAQ